MRPAERRDLRRARTLLRAGRYVDAERVLRSLDALPVLPHGEVHGEQLVLTNFYLSLPFYCERVRASLTVEACLVLRSRIWPSGAGKGCPRRVECIGCAVGAANQARVPGFVPPPSTLAPEVMTNSQRMARRARQLVGLEDGETVRVDPLREAATLSPDDESDWRG